MQNAIQTLTFNNTAVSFRADGFLNATAIAAHFGKQPRDYLKTEQTQEYIDALAEYLVVKKKILTDKNQLVVIKQGGKQQGTWLHPKLAIHFARWLDAKFAVWCDEQIENLLSGSLPDPYRSRPVAGGLSAEQISVVKAFHRQLVQCAPKEQQARLAVTLWSGIKRKFGTAYKNIAPEYYPEILSLMGRIAVHKGAAPFYIEGAPFANTQSISFDGSQDAKYLIEIKDGKIISCHELTVSRSCVPTPC